MKRERAFEVLEWVATIVIVGGLTLFAIWYGPPLLVDLLGGAQ